VRAADGQLVAVNATGVTAAFRVKGRKDVKVVAQGGDGGTTDIGFGCLSGMFERNDDVLYLCYDNEAYMNTGVQRSSATPPTARTATTQAIGPAPGNVFGTGKNLPLIAMAHNIPYVATATATVADLHDLEDKVARTMAMSGARYIHIMIPCPLGWGSAADTTIPVARLAVESGLFPRSRPSTEKSRISKKNPPPGAGRGLSANSKALCPSVRQGRQGRRQNRCHPAHGRPQYRALRPVGPREEAMTANINKQLSYAITLEPGTSLANHTGSWRTVRPVYRDRLPPCNDACPAGENIQGWLYYAEEGDYETAWQLLMRDNPMPAVMGRVCYHPCENACNRADLDEAVAIHAVARFLGDQAIKNGWAPDLILQSTGKRVLVVGAGPSGLSAAYHLRRLGHAVIIREAGPMAGGMMRFGIPKYRRPRDVLDNEIQRILDLGVELQLNRKVDDIPAAFKTDGFEAVFIAVGAHLAKRIDIPAYAAGKILDAASVLRDMETGAEPPQLRRRVIVYGGGNTAMDAARTAKRLGVEQAMIVYRRSRKEMPAHDFEATEAEEEGVLIHWLRTIKQIDETTFTVERMEIDDNGRPQPTGELETLEADTLILALGQDVDTSCARSKSTTARRRPVTSTPGSRARPIKNRQRTNWPVLIA